MSKILFKRISLILFITVTGSFFSGCTFVRQSVAVLRSTDHFVTHKNDSRLLFEPGAEVYANKVALFIPSAIEQVEAKQQRSFIEPVRIYICASRER